MLKKIYKCDICLDEKSVEQLMGCRFIDYYTFRLGTAGSTDGRHICLPCLRTLKEELMGLDLDSKKAPPEDEA